MNHPGGSAASPGVLPARGAGLPHKPSSGCGGRRTLPPGTASARREERRQAEGIQILFPRRTPERPLLPLCGKGGAPFCAPGNILPGAQPRKRAAPPGRPFSVQSACVSFAEISLGTFPRNYRLLISHSSGKIRSSRSRVPSRSIGFSSFEFQDNSTILCSHPGKIARNRARKRKIFFPDPVFEIFPSAHLTSRADRGILHFAGDLPVWRNW